MNVLFFYIGTVINYHKCGKKSGMGLTGLKLKVLAELHSSPEALKEKALLSLFQLLKATCTPQLLAPSFMEANEVSSL